MKDYRVTVDIGGTFTDIVALNQRTGEMKTAKVSTTPKDLTICIVEGVKKVVEDFSQIDFFVHGTTHGLNAFLERRGAKTALLTTKGFRDVYEIGRASRSEMYDLFWHRPEMLIKRRDIFEVTERLFADGTVRIPIDKEEVKQIALKIKEEEYEAVAVCLLHSYANPIHENMIEEIFAEAAPEVNVSLSHTVANEWREYERTSTVVLNAYITPVMRRYLNKLEQELKKEGYDGKVYIMQSNGGVITSEMAKHKTVQTFFSGPVGGTIGGKYVGQLINEKNLICVDMGGTSFDVSLIIDGEPDVGNETYLEGFPILTPVVNIHTVGAGGGSIAWEEVGGLRVGPQSAGAEPGPACYGRGGTEATVTDSNLVLGRVDEENFLGGEMSLDVDASKKAVKNIADTLHMDFEELADGVLRVANLKMTNAIRELTVQKGIDPRDFALVAFGGAGPMHSMFLADELNIKKTIVPYSPGTFSAFGMLQTDIRHDFVSSYFHRVSEIDLNELENEYLALEEKGRALLKEDKITEDQIVFRRVCDMRYLGQEYTLLVTLQGKVTEESIKQLTKDFHEGYFNKYGHNNEQEEVEIVNIRLIAIGQIAKAELKGLEKPDVPEKPKPIKVKQVYYDGKYMDCPLYQRESLQPGQCVLGPSIILETSCTTVVPPKHEVKVDDFGNLIITKEMEG